MKAVGETWRNSERTGEHTDFTLSEAVRHVGNGVRNTDIDMFQLFPLGGGDIRFEIVMESSRDPEKASTYIRSLSKQLRCFAMLIVHPDFQNVMLQDKEPVSFYLWSPSGELITKNLDGSWKDFQKMCQAIHDHWDVYEVRYGVGR